MRLNQISTTSLTALLLGIALSVGGDDVAVEVQNVAGGRVTIVIEGQSKADNSATEEVKPESPKANIDPKIVTFGPLKAAFKAAAEDGRLILLTTRADWDPWSLCMQESIYETDRFDELMAMKYIVVPLVFNNTELDEGTGELQQELDIRSLPESLVLDADGQVKTRIGYIQGGLDDYIAALSNFGPARDNLEILKTDYYGGQIPLQLNEAMRRPIKPVDMNKFNEMVTNPQNRLQAQWQIQGGIQIVVEEIPAPAKPKD